MLKTIIFVCIAIALSIMAATQFAGALEKASATRANRDDRRRRVLDLGIKGRAVMAGIFAVVMLLLAWMSNIMLLSTIVCLILSVLLVLANVYLKGNYIDALPALFFIWVGNVISSLKNAGLMVGNKWGTVYIILQVVCLVLMALLTALGNYSSYRRMVKKEDIDAERLEEDVDKAEDEEREKAEARRKAKAAKSKAKVEEDVAEETDDDDDEEEDEGSFRDFVRSEAFKNGLLIVVIIAIVIIGFVLEWKLDYFPPYR